MLDVTITISSLIAVFGIAYYSTVRQRSAKKADGFFLAGRNMPWWIIAASLFASNIGAQRGHR